MIIYKTTNIVNKKFYIGRDLYNNLSYIGSGKLLKLAIKKYGINNFIKETIETCTNIYVLNLREIYWIQYYGSCNRNKGYNIALGGTGGDTLSNHPNKKEISLKISNANKGRLIGYKHNEETLINMRNAQLKLCRKWSEEHKEMLSLSQKGISKPWKEGRTVSEETRLKISHSNMGKISSKKGIKNEKHSEYMKVNNPFKGKTHTEETRKILSEKNKGRVKSEEHCEKLSKSLKGRKGTTNKKVIIDEVTYDSVYEASVKLNINYSTLHNRIKSKTYKNYNLL